MDNFPPRSPVGDRATIQRYNELYWNHYLVSGIAVLILFLGVLAGFGFSILFGYPLLLGVFVGGIAGAVGFNYLITLLIRGKSKERDALEENKRDNREEEFQRKLAEAKKNGDFDQFGDNK